ncbi:major histocompatibility complex class I-related gene protein-like [Carassius auratus]|uniref:Major histocompatibility complex class I-related gene protein-like n=1 Tax=Carassius auratus TaxID=7957 RepID=A0A6P6LK22_CARAU|nr:major histocompatibility complex class I-related gene protein-like [Carassius auratus]
MVILLYLLSCLKAVNAGSHLLMYFATYIIGQTPFPEFTVVGMLDDVQVRYYDSVTQRAVSHSHNDTKHYDEEQTDDIVIFRDMYYNLKDRAYYLKDNLNLSDGVHVHQRLAGCELLENDKPGPIYTWDAFNGQMKEWGIFDAETKILEINLSLIRAWDQHKRIYVNFLYENIYHPICLKILRRNMKKSSILQKVKPRVRLLKKVLAASHEYQITCLVTGFYPRDINVTLVRDGQTADNGKITGGNPLPNGDGTYQIRKSLVMSVKELHDRHNYSCAINHSSLDNTLDIMFDLEETGLGLSTLSVVTSSCLVVFIWVPLIITALIIWKRKRHAAGPDFRTSQSDYSPTPTQDT